MALQTVFGSLEEVLKKDERLTSDDGRLLKNKAVELANKLDEGLIRILFENKEFKKIFFKKIGDLTLFDKDLFIEFVSNKEFLPDSYTAFKNKIGLATGRDYLKQGKQVSLVWPYKDCVLEGGQTKEEAKRGEIFWNTTLAPDEINRLLEPKVFTNWKRYDKEGEKKGRVAEETNDTDNLVIKGNNLIALHSLKKRFAGKVQLIYIDPPYNTGNDTFGYNDTFNHSTWLTFMRNRLEVARQLLAEDGSIYVQLDYNEVHYAKVLMDEIFGPAHFQREIIWDTTVLSGYKTMANNWVRGHDSILFYTKSSNFLFNKLSTQHSDKYLARFDKIDENGKKYFDGRGGRRYLDEVVKKGKAIGDVWNDIMSFQQIPTSKERWNLDGQKPEKLLQRIIESSTNEGDLVLDYHAGTGTTGAVAHKMKRQYILIEQMDYIHELPEARLKAVIEGEQGGISKEIGWKGGGSFVYTELMPLNEKFVRKVEVAKTKKDVVKIWDEVQNSGFVSYRVDPEKFDAAAREFADLDLEKQKAFVLESLDANMLYVNYNDINDKEYGVSEEDKKLNSAFYAA